MNNSHPRNILPGRQSLAPVVIFAYARPDHLRTTVESLLVNPEATDTDVVFYCDAAKRPEHQPGVDAVREYVRSVRGFRSVRWVFRDHNMGLAASIVQGVGEMLSEHGSVIVLEDDLLLSPHFLRYMDDGLERYADDHRVASIHGYSYPVERPLPETFFLRGADCWGWATWSRAWAHLRLDGRALLAELRERRLTKDFDFDWQYPYTGMLVDQIAGRNSSWAILWHASCYLEGLLTLYPGRSLVENIGNDASGTHCQRADDLSRKPTTTPVPVSQIPVCPSTAGRAAFVHFFGRRRTISMQARSAVKRLLKGYA